MGHFFTSYVPLENSIWNNVVKVYGTENITSSANVGGKNDVLGRILYLFVMSVHIYNWIQVITCQYTIDFFILVIVIQNPWYFHPDYHGNDSNTTCKE